MGNEVICENRGRIVGVPVVAEPVHIPVPLAVIPVEVQRVPLAVRTAKLCMERHPGHHPLKYLGVEPYSASHSVE